MILILDNYDSFVHNVARYMRELGATVEVARSDSLSVDDVRALRPAGIVLSPGPRTPGEAGESIPIIRSMAAATPILGICLGHQAVAEAFGAVIVRAEEPVHGRSSAIHHLGAGILAGLPRPFAAARYHSLVVAPESIPAELEVCAWTAEGTVMALRHRRHPVWGVQFHPESILTEGGFQIFSNYLLLCARALPFQVPA